MLLARQLSFLGHRITSAEDGAQGFALWQAGHFDGVITDCNMPFKDGYALARDIRAQEHQLGLTPCLLLGFTANALPQEAERCRQAGMDGCLFKPTGLEDLRLALAPRTAGVATDNAGAAFDLSPLLTLTQGDDDALSELLTPLLDSLEEDRALLSTLKGQGAFAKLHDLAHRVKGGARLVKAEVLTSCCETLEGACERRDRGALDAAVESVDAAIEQLQHSLSRYGNQA